MKVQLRDVKVALIAVMRFDTTVLAKAYLSNVLQVNYNFFIAVLFAAKSVTI